MLRTLSMLPVFGVIVSYSVAVAAAENEKTPAAKPGITVKLTISAEEYDPETPSKATVKCTVVNDGTETIQVTSGYDGQNNLLLAGNRWDLTLYPFERRKADPKSPDAGPQTVQIKPKAEETVFELNLGEILAGSSPDGTRKWRWDWSARPAPPRSPIHQMRGLGYVKQVDFRAEVLIGGKPCISDKVTLRIKQPLHEPR